MAKAKKTSSSSYAERLKERKRLSGSKGYNSLNKGQVKKLPIPLPMFQDA